MNIVIVGLGLIGGSLAKALKKYTLHHVIGIDTNPYVLTSALDYGVVDEAGSDESLKDADITILSIYPEQIVEYAKSHAKLFKKGSVVTDTCGIKKYVCDNIKPVAEQNGFVFIGGHPMAGKEVGGLENSEAELFKKASYIFTPLDSDENGLQTLCELADAMHFARTVITTPDEHDSMIAYTSQIPHVLACSYVLDERSRKHEGYSAGSFRDVSRVATINETLWTQLFLNNREQLTAVLDNLTGNIKKIRDDIANGDDKALKEILKQAREIKEGIAK